MEDNSVVRIFKSKLDNWLGRTDFDCSTYKNHLENGNMYIPRFRANFNIPQDEEILFTRDTSTWNNQDEGLVITNKGLYLLRDNDKPNEIDRILWSDFDNVVFHSNNFYFYRDNIEIIKIYEYRFFKTCDKEKCIKLAEILSEIAKVAESEYDVLIRLVEKGEYDDAITIVNKLINQNTYDRAARLIKCEALYNKGTANDKNDECILLDCIKESVSLIKILDEEDDIIFWLYYYLGSTYEKIRKYEKAREYLIRALPIDDVDKEQEIQELLEKVEDELRIEWEQYTQKHSYLDRRLIMPIKDDCIAGCISDEIKTFRLSHLPSDFEFPATIPVANQLYIGHRYNPNVYIPFEQSEEYFFLDKVDELCNLLQCLGAKTITIKRVVGKDIGELYKGEFEAKGNLGHKLAEAEIQKNKEGSTTRENKKRDSYERCLVYDKPSKLPYIPNDLHWFHYMKKWQTIANERVQNGGKVGSSFHEHISTSETRFYSSSELDTINAAVKILLFKANANVNNKEEKEYKESANTEWSIDVEFWAMDDKEETVDYKKTLTDAEIDYLKAIRDFSSDGIISDEERPFVEQIRKKLNINEDRATDIEQMLHLTEVEKGYVDMYHSFLEKGELSESDIRKLERYRLVMDISEDRAKEITTNM